MPKIKEMNRDPYDHRICAICLAPMEPAFSNNIDYDNGFNNDYNDDMKNSNSRHNPSLNLFTNPFNKYQSNALTNPITSNLANNAPNLFFNPPLVPIESSLIKTIIDSKPSISPHANPVTNGESNMIHTENQEIKSTTGNTPAFGAFSLSSPPLTSFNTVFPDTLLSRMNSIAPISSDDSKAKYPGSGGYSYPDSFVLPASNFPSVIEKAREKENKSCSYQMGGLLLQMGGVTVVDGSSVGVNNNADIYTAISSSSMSSTQQSSSSNEFSSIDARANPKPYPYSPIPSISAPLTAASEETKAKTNPLRFHRLTCIDCGIHVHLGCHNELGYTFINEITPDIIAGAAWKCDSCAVDEKDPRCVLCPRRGGAFKATSDSRWAHAFCCRNAPGQTRIIDGVAEVRVPKDCKKVKCGVCNRQQGACVRCAYLGCTAYFHPLCAERGGKGYLRTRSSEREAFCHQHIPEGVDRCDGYLVDGGEIHRLRITLDRSRVILDTLLRREKAKVRLCKVESEFFSSTFSRTLDRGKGRKHLLGLECHDMDEESEYGDGDEDDEYGIEMEGEDDLFGDISLVEGVINGVDSGVGGGGVIEGSVGDRKQQVEKAKAELNMNEHEHRPMDFTVNRGEDKVLEYKGNETFISGAWVKGTEIALPRRLVVMVVGLPIQRKETAIEGGRKAYLRILKEKVDENLAISRSQSDIFLSAREAQEFAKKLTPSLLKHMNMSETEFAESMKKSLVQAFAIPDFEKMRSKQQSKALRANMERVKKDKSEASRMSYSRPPALYDAPADLGDSKRRRVTIHPNLSLNKVLDGDGEEEHGHGHGEVHANGKNLQKGKKEKEKEPRRSGNGKKDIKDKNDKSEKDGNKNEDKDKKKLVEDNSVVFEQETLGHEAERFSAGEGVETMMEVSGMFILHTYYIS